MITRVEAHGFRSIQYVSQPLERFHVLVGPNGAGKSSFLDIVGFLGDMLSAGPGPAVLGDTRLGVTSRASDPRDLAWMREGNRFELAVELEMPVPSDSAIGTGRRSARYEVAVTWSEPGSGEDFADQGIRLEAETLFLIPRRKPGGREGRQLQIFPSPSKPPRHLVIMPGRQAKTGWRRVVSKTDSGNDYFKSETTGWNNQFRLGPNKSALANLPEDQERFPVATWVKRVLMEGLQTVVLSAESMRSPSAPGSPTRFLPDGSNLPWVVESLARENPERFSRWVRHLRTAVPDILNVRTEDRPNDRHRYLVVEYTNGLEAPSWVVSDGTLRMLALTLLAYLPDRDALYLIEEPENGIHPTAVESVYQSLSSVYESQVLMASHSPVVLSLASPDEVLCFAQAESGATDVVNGAEHPRLRQWKGAVDLGTVFATGVLG